MVPSVEIVAMATFVEHELTRRKANKTGQFRGVETWWDRLPASIRPLRWLAARGRQNALASLGAHR